MDAEAAPQLDKPGAGIPLHQKLLFRYVVKPFVSSRGTWEDDTKRFDAIAAKILNETGTLDAASLERRILIPPQTGLEDSSRYWSVAMTLEHIVIVSNGISRAIIALSNGVVTDGKPDTAAVKPHAGINGAEALSMFGDYVADAMQKLDAKVGDRASKLTYAHPWFGDFNAHQWHWLLGIHQGLHLKQIREIVKRL